MIPTSSASWRMSFDGMVVSMMWAVTNAGIRPSRDVTRMHARTAVCWRQYGANRPPTRRQSTRRSDLGLSGEYMLEYISP